MKGVKDAPEKKTQRLLLCTWMIELKIDRLKKLEAVATNGSADTTVQQQKQQKEEAYNKAVTAFRNFIQDYEIDLDTDTVFQLLQSHARLGDFLHFAAQKVMSNCVVMH